LAHVTVTFSPDTMVKPTADSGSKVLFGGRISPFLSDGRWVGFVSLFPVWPGFPKIFVTSTNTLLS
jgi:hypothetical protein